jgi:ABC-type multidrug transport system fused ATPase/permease subunit
MKPNKTDYFYVIRKVVAELFSYSPGNMAGLFIFLFFSSIMPSFITISLSRLYDTAELVIKGNMEGIQLVRSLVLLGVFFLLSSITNNLFFAFMNHMDERAKYRFGDILSINCTKMPLILYEDSHFLNAKERAHECVNRSIPSDLFLQICNLLMDIIEILSLLFVLATFNFMFILIVTISVLPFLIIRIYRGREFYKLKWMQAKKARRTKYLFKLFLARESTRDMRTMGLYEYIQQLWKASRYEMNEEIWSFRKKDLKSLLWCEFIKIAGYLLGILLAVFLAAMGKISIGTFGACISAISSVQSAMQWFLVSLGRIPEYILFMQDYYYFLKYARDEKPCIKFTGLHNKISISNVFFSYPTSNGYAISDINLDIRLREKVAIVGANGSGKTTLIKLLLGAYEAEMGDVLFDGRSVKDIDKNTLYSKISILTQSFLHLYLTVRENIALNQLSEKENTEKIIWLLERVGLAKEVMQFKDGLDTYLGIEFGGKELSEGQWQKLAICRALFRESEIMILDEPTSALDPITESEILQTFLDIVKDKTAIIITHRMAVCQFVDKIVVLQRGKIVEYGSHAELYKKKESYYNLFNEQKKWYI